SVSSPNRGAARVGSTALFSRRTGEATPHAFSALRRSDLRPATLRHHERRIDEAFRFIQGAFVAKLVCCARAASGHAAAPPSTVMNSRRLTRSPRRRTQAGDRENQPQFVGGFYINSKVYPCGLLDGHIGWLCTI